MLGEVRIDVEQGASLSGAMAKHPKVFNDLFVAMVKSGETGGSLDDVLLRLADMIEREVKLRGKIKSAMTYPVAVVALVVLIMSAMLLFVVPQFERSTRSSAARCRCRRGSCSTMSNIVKKLLVHRADRQRSSVRFFFKRWKKTETGRAAVDAIKLQVPVFGPLFHKTALSRFSSDARDAAALRRADPAGPRHRGDTVNNQVGRDRDRRRAGSRSARASRWPSRSRRTRSSRRWSCR